ncbi:glycosyltransferase family 2 protein [Streptomyces sp. ICBB 8177]|uniref:glycosyltransferase n=1 Tax=Streptomyces sp. ICBB 8177 TaxID=563922 RepID=UPI000D681FEB|nr:glycosyltransferase family 2 protein [Streptomyces sp. ICBB 8177]PWI42925.1 glycosyl transferase [Streptomyces sp. ICBB 8177]
MIRAVLVVVPAHDEEALIADCLASVARAAAHPRLAGVAVATTVVADACRDDTAAIARRHGARVVEVVRRNVGAARAAGTRSALTEATATGLAPASVWLAHTDADSQVPHDWLADHLDRAAEGFDAVLGTVDVHGWSRHAPLTRVRYLHDYHAYRATSREHPHVHGANLGVRADAYLGAGGFRPLATGEDRALAAALERRRCRIHRCDSRPVRTSGRRDFRAPGGLGSLLADIAATREQSVVPPPPLSPGVG